MSRGPKKDEAIAIAGSAAAKAAYGAMDGAKEPVAEGSTAVKVKEPPKKDDPAKQPADDETDDGEDDEAPSPVVPSGRSVRRVGVGMGRGGFVDRTPASGFARRSFSGHGATGDMEDDEGHEVTSDVYDVLDSIPKNERASVLFKFRQRKLVSNGKTLLRPVAELTFSGDPGEAQASIREELAQFGPGIYDGIPHTTDGKPLRGGAHWTPKITEEEARAVGWRPDDERTEAMTTATAQTPAPLPALAGPTNGQASPDEDDVEKAARREKGRIDLLKHTLETTKLEIQLQELRQGGASAVKKPESAKDGVTEEALKRIVDAEKAKAEAEHKAALAKADAEREKELSRIKADQEKEIARVKADAESERRKAEDALRDLRSTMDRKEAEHAGKIAELQRGMESSADKLKEQFKDQIAGLKDTFEKDRVAERNREKDRERDKQPERKPEETAVAVASALTNTFSPILTPLINAWAQKMSQPPAPPPSQAPAPDPVKQMESMAKIFAPILDRATAPAPAPLPPPPAPPPVDVMDIMSKATDMVFKMMPKEKGPKTDEIADIVERAVERKLPAIQQAPVQPQDPFAFADKILGYAKGMADMQPRFVEQEREGRDDREEREEREPADPLEQAEKTLSRLERFGVKVQIGQPAPAPEQPKPTTIQEIFQGARAMVPDIGDAVAKYMNSRQPTLDPDLVRKVQMEELRKRTGIRKKTGQPQQVQPQQVQQPAHVQQPQQVQQPQRAVQPRQPAQHAVQPRQQQPTQVQRPQQPMQQRQPAQPQQRPQQPQQRPQQPQQPHQQGNRYAPPPPAIDYNIPTVLMPSRALPPPGFVPQESVPRRPGAEASKQRSANIVPVEQLPAGQAARLPSETVPQRPGQPTHRQQTRPAQWQPASQQPAQRPQPAPQQQTPAQAPQTPTTAPEPAHAPASEVLDANGLPTLKSWSDLSAYASSAISKNEDPAVAALHLLEQYPVAAKFVMNVASEMGGIDAVDTMLTNYAADAGPYADMIGELASKVRNNKEWAGRLILALRGTPA